MLLNNPVFLYATVICSISDLSNNLMDRIRYQGYEPIDVRYLNQCGERYKNLFKDSGVRKDTFARWFNEVFRAHECGFRLENPNINIRSYDPLECVVTELAPQEGGIKGILKPPSASFRIIAHLETYMMTGTLLRFKASSVSDDVHEMEDHEIEALYLRPSLFFRTVKPKIAATGNTLGSMESRTLGRRFGNPNAIGIMSRAKQAIEYSMKQYVNIKKNNSLAYLDKIMKDYTETMFGEGSEALSSEGLLALQNMDINRS
jgi:hypothetical protein